jgi:hypothetical protein
LEWRLADQRTHLMGRAKAFLLPVCVDGTRDADADVPDSFVAVQWTRLPGGETPVAFAERVKKLLLGDRAPESKEPSEKVPTAAPGSKRLSRSWLIPAIAAVIACAALAIWQPWRKSEKSTAQVLLAAPESEARQLLARVWEQLNKTGIGPEELELADGYCKHAASLDPADAEVWAAWSQVNSLYVGYQFDKTPARREAARSDAARALKLAPVSFEARLAQACFLFRADSPLNDSSASTFVLEADRLLRQLLLEKPDEPRALSAFGGVQQKLGHLEEGRHTFLRLARNPEYAARAWRDFAFLEYYFAHNGSAAEALIDRSLAIQQYWGNLSVKAAIAMY